jgi:pectate lyase
VSNVILQNIKIHHAPTTPAKEQDLISLENATKVWLDHCEIFNEIGDLNQDGVVDIVGDIDGGDVDWYDGSFDAKKASTDITVSWCYFHDSFKTSLLGSGATDTLMRNAKITYHHNVFWNVKLRCPSFRFGTGHIFNNYFGNVMETGIYSRIGAKLLIEGNVFEEVGSGKQDLKCKLQLFEGPIGAYYDSIPGLWDVKDNIFENCKGNQPDTSTCTLTVACDYDYDYASALQPASAVKATLLQKAGTESGVTLTPKFTTAIKIPLNRSLRTGTKNIGKSATYNALGAKVNDGKNVIGSSTAAGVYIENNSNSTQPMLKIK